jgi:LPS export ABC transporter protein LptC
MRWQQSARIGVAVVGIVSAVVIYRAIGRRPAHTPPAAVARLDPTASIESTGAVLQRVHGAEEDFELTHETALTYADGSTKQFGVRISVKRRGGRDYVVTAAEASAGQGQRTLQLTGDVRVAASDGFSLTTESAVFDRDMGVVRAPGPVSFTKGRMTGGGVGMTYEQNVDVLHILTMPEVQMMESEGVSAARFSAGSATLDRAQDFLRLTGDTRVSRGAQTLESDETIAHLTEDEQFITFIEMRGHSRVNGGDGVLESMTARDINLVYADDGERLERVALSGEGTVALAPAAGERGRTIGGDSLDLVLGPEGNLAGASGRGGVRLEMPAASSRAARSVRATSFEATGAAGAGLTDARFVEAVEYLEEGRAGGKGRMARSRTLDLGLEGEGVRSAVFTGGVTFEEPGGLRARAASLRYAPDSGTLQLTGSDAGGGPRVADERITIEGESIDVGLENRRMTARGSVKTTLAALRTGVPRDVGAGVPRGTGAGVAVDSGLLDRNRPINVNANALTYAGDADTATYSGEATLWQGDTAIRADTIALDQAKGDLIAVGSARSTMALDGSVMVGRATEIRYSDAARAVAYGPEEAAASIAAGRRGGAATEARPEGAPAQLSGTHGDLRARRIEVVLAAGQGTVDRVEAYRDVSMTLRARKASGGRLTYHSADERYVLTGSAAAPVSVVDACRAVTGKTLTFFRSTDRIVVDGDRELRTRTKSGGPCEPATAR